MSKNRHSPLIQLEALKYAVNGAALIDGISLEVSNAGLTTIIGPNGAGKSTLLRLLSGLLEPTAGALTWHTSANPTAGTCRSALVFQRPVILRRTVEANIRHAIAPLKLDQPAAQVRLSEALSSCRLEHLRDAPARRLSGGEQQGLALARALARHPMVLLLDEPCANLDPTATASIEQIIRQTAARGTKIIIVTHNVAQAQRLADTVVFLDHGKVLETSSAGQFFTEPKSQNARDYLSGRLPGITDCKNRQ